jgi:hypothetical protein
MGTLAERPLVGKCILLLLVFFLSLGATFVRAAFAAPAKGPADETFVAERLLARLLADRAMKESFRDLFRTDTHRNKPSVVPAATASNCTAIIAVEIAPDNIVKKWDGSPDPRGLSAAGLFFDLRTVEADRTQFYYDKGKLNVALLFRAPIDVSERLAWEQKYLAPKFRYGTSNDWQPLRLDSDHLAEIGAAKSLLTLFGVYQRVSGEPTQLEVAWFEIREDQRDETVAHLKSIFARCRL